MGSRWIIQKLQKAIRYTEQAFERQSKIVAKHFSNYQSALILLLEEDCDFDPKLYARERWIFTKWRDATEPFIQLVEQKKSEKVDRLFKRFSGKTASGKLSVFKKAPNFRELNNYQTIINVTRQIPMKPPLAALKKLSWKRRLFQEEEKALKMWIDKIHALGDQVKVWTFHKGMQALVKHVEMMHRTRYVKRPRADDLELGLAKYGLNIYKQKDQKHMDWCSTIKAGEVLEIRGQKYPIEREFFSCKIDNKLRVFTVKNNPRRVIIVGQNRAILSIKQKGAREFSWGIRPVSWFEVSQDGRFAVAERLKTSLKKRNWKSGRDKHLDDILLLKPVVDQVKWFIEQKATPKNLDSSYLMYDQMNSLKSTKILIKGEFDYPKLVDFCKGCANGNLTVYNYLAQETGLSTHPYQKYFREVVKRTSDGKEDLPEDIGALQQFEITDHHVIDRGKLLRKKILKLQNKCMRKLTDEFDFENPLTVAKEVSKLIYQEYLQKNYLCILWPKMKKRIVAETVKKLGLSEQCFDEDLF